MSDDHIEPASSLRGESSAWMSIPPRPDGLASTVLIVDDDGAARLLMRRWLEKAGIIVTEVESGDQAIEQIEKLGARLGAVLLDVMLPGKDGFTVLSELRAIPEYSQLPVVVLSAHAQDEQDVIRSLNVGADDHIAKPFSGPVIENDGQNKRHRPKCGMPTLCRFILSP